MGKNGAHILAFDVGGSHIGAALLRIGEAVPLAECTEPIDEAGAAGPILQAFSAATQQLLQTAGVAPSQIEGAGIGMPNPFDYERGISLMRHKFASLYGLDLRRELGGLLGVEPQSICFVNDAVAYLLGEVHFGAAQGFERVIGVTLGTGLGAAFAVNGQIVTGGVGVPEGGMLWDYPLDGGIAEDFISTRAIQKIYGSFTDRRFSVLEIAGRAEFDPAARATWRQFGGVLGSVLQRTCTPFEPQAIVLGGAIARSASLFLPMAAQQMAGIELRPSALFETANLLGAGAAWAEPR